MYYHCRPIKYVAYGKVNPPPLSEYDEFDERLYGWLGKHCGYYPQIWLSKSDIHMTGYKKRRLIKKTRYRSSTPKRRQFAKISNDSVLFGFDIIKGFPLSYDHWELMMCSIVDDSSFDAQNVAIEKTMNEILKDYIHYNETLEGPIKDWDSSGKDFSRYLVDFVFKEVDQVVVPNLNLKSAKKIICHNEKQRKKLRKMGFIEDRIKIQNSKHFSSF